MAHAQKTFREDSRLHSPQSENWSKWKTAMVPLYDRINTVNRHQNQVGFIWKYILNDGNLPELCGIYEWRAIRQDQPNRVVYVGSTCTRCGNSYEPLQSRILGYCSHGNHKEALINDALTKGYTLEVRYKQAWNELQARNLENELLDMFNYAWNERRNGGKCGIRLLPIWYVVI